MRILLAEDEVALARALKKILEKNHYSVDAVHNGTDAAEYLSTGIYDGVILDVMMPGMDGISVLRQLRARGSQIPVLLLTARSEVEDKVLGLDSGANDYLTKPFDSQELLARLRAMTRSREAVDSRLCFGNVTLDRASFTLSAPGGSFRLSNREYQLMELLMTNPRQLLSTERLMEKIWGFASEAELNVVWAYISYLRKKLAALEGSIQIKAVRNAGYCLEEKHDS